MKDTDVGLAYQDLVRRFLGEECELRFLTPKKGTLPVHLPVGHACADRRGMGRVVCALQSARLTRRSLASARCCSAGGVLGNIFG